MKSKKVKKPSIKKLQEILWDLCRKLIDKIYCPDGKAVCYTCGTSIEGSNKHLSHFIPRSTCGASLKYDLRNLRWCCMRCNVWLGGNGATFYRNMVKLEGQAYVDELFRIKNQVSIKADIIFYMKKIKEYEDLLKYYTQ